MNNRFFVPVLALGIAALGAAASPSQAATATLGSWYGPNSGGIPSWLDTVTLEAGSTWDSATQEEAQNGGPWQVVGTPMSTGPNGIPGPGSPNTHFPITFPANGQSYNYQILNYGSAHGGCVSWEVTAGTGTVTNNNGTMTVVT